MPSPSSIVPLVMPFAPIIAIFRQYGKAFFGMMLDIDANAKGQGNGCPFAFGHGQLCGLPLGFT